MLLHSTDEVLKLELDKKKDCSFPSEVFNHKRLNSLLKFSLLKF